MHKLLSLPENLVASFHALTGKSCEDWFVLSDPPGSRIGSGGGTAHLLYRHLLSRKNDHDWKEYLASGKKILIHAGGQSRRLPAYAPSGKLLAPIPVFRWSRGQRLDQTLLDQQIPLLEKIMAAAGPLQNLMVAAGDVLIQSPEVPFELPAADVVCFGIWVDPHLASHHGVFFSPRSQPQQLDFMLQKPEHATIEKLSATHLYLMDIGIWVFSDRAVALLMEQCGWNGKAFQHHDPEYYDLYSSFGTCLGDHPSQPDPAISQLSVAIVPMHKGEFYHYGTSAELITSSEKIQNRVLDQRNIWHYRVKPHPSLFVQNAITDIRWENHHHHIWIENSHVPATWKLQHHHVITGIPRNDWEVTLPPGICIDCIPVGENQYCLRPYGLDDVFRGGIGEETTLWMGKSVLHWLQERHVALTEAGFTADADLQMTPLFPLLELTAITSERIHWMLHADGPSDCKTWWRTAARLSADQINSRANQTRLFAQRTAFRDQNLVKLAANYKRSVFYQTDLKYAAQEYARAGIPLPDPIPETESAMLRFRDRMFRSEVMRMKGLHGASDEAAAFGILQAFIAGSLTEKVLPRLNMYADQIVWGRSPARLDLAGGWSDTPPYCLQHGGSVLNVAVELNGQPPIQVYIRLCSERNITLRSIDNGVSEIITSFDELRDYKKVGSAFSIPLAALCLAGFHPDFCAVRFASLQQQLEEFGGGFEISLLVAIPKGSGLGTSSILAATILGTLSDFCSLNWDHQVLCHRTLILEQLLTTGGGWQDQYGGILPGIKLLESEPGSQEKISVRWMPDRLFTHPAFRDCWLLYYTGITRVAKNILADIVRGMFLNEGHRLQIVDEIRKHAYYLAEAIQRSDFGLTGKLVAQSWRLNNALDIGTNTEEVQRIIDLIHDYTIGFKLLGAGGGGYMLICAKDHEAAGKIRAVLTSRPLNEKARFVRMEVSQTGFQVSRS
jgi:galactokinase/mevalonate kinase-like predicted kinase